MTIPPITAPERAQGIHPVVANHLSGGIAVDSLLGAYRWAADSARGAVAITYSFGDGTAEYYVDAYPDANGNGLAAPEDGAKALSAGEKQAVRDALAQWAAVANIRFVEVEDSAEQVGTLRFSYTSGGAKGEAPTAYTYMPGIAGNAAWAGDIWIGDVFRNHNPQPGSYAYTHILLHEIGHALGLKHPHEGQAQQNFGPVAPPEIDSTLFSIMSYRDYAGDNIDTIRVTNVPRGPMLHDIAAIQHLYGANTQHHTGPDVYFDEAAERVFPQTLWDAGGIDRIDWSGQNQAVEINLSPGSFSKIGPGFQTESDPASPYESRTLAIARHTWIENADGGSGNDTLSGNTRANTLRGFAGNDRLLGMSGNDALVGGAGNDVLDGGSGADVVFGGEGNDVFYVDAVGDVVLELPDQGRDTVRSTLGFTLGNHCENLFLVGALAVEGTGNALSNLLVGNGQANVLFGGGANDSLAGAGANDRLDGGAGQDRLLGAVAGGDFGRGEIDTLIGGAGRDVFVLGTAAGHLYDDGLENSAGTGDYAVIADFLPGQDRLQLHGAAADFSLGGSPVVGGVGLWLQQGVAEELLAVLIPLGTAEISVAQTLDTALWV